MTRRGRRWTEPNGQLDDELRGRDESGLLIAQLEELRALIGGITAIGVDCWATGPTAAALHRFDGFTLRRPFHVMVRRGHNVIRVGHVVHTSSDIPLQDCEEAHGVPVLSPTRTLLTLASTETRPHLIAALDGAIRDRQTTETYLHRRIGELRRSGRPGVTKLLAAVESTEITRGGASWLEREFLRLMGSAGLPRPETQQVLGRRKDTLIRVDFRFTGTPIVVEVLGYRWHHTRPHLLGDVERTNRLTLLGFQVVQFTYPQLVDTPAYVVDTMRTALELCRSSGSSSVSAATHS